MWRCSYCDAYFLVASASSEEDLRGEIIGGVECPDCGAFIPDEDLIHEDEEET